MDQPSRFKSFHARPSLFGRGDGTDEELPVLDVTGLIQVTGTAPLIEAIRIRCGFTPEFFQRGVACCLDALAETVQLLPADRAEVYRQPGGLWVLSLETAAWALGLRRGRLLPVGAAPEDLGALGPRWTYGVFLVALLHPLLAVLGRVRVTAWAGSGPGRAWSPFGQTLGELGRMGCRVERRPPSGDADKALRGLPLLWVGRHVPPTVLSWLSEDERLMAEIVGCLGGGATPKDSAIADIVAQATGTQRAETFDAVTDTTESVTGETRQGSSPRSALHGHENERAPGVDDADAYIEDVDARRRTRSAPGGAAATPPPSTPSPPPDRRRAGNRDSGRGGRA